MAQSCVDERAGSGAPEQRAALAARPLPGRMGISYGIAGLAGGCGGVAAKMVWRVLSFFNKGGVQAWADGWVCRSGNYFLCCRNAAGAGPPAVRQRPVAPAAPARR